MNYPSLGAIVAKECGQSDTGLPSYINLGSSSVPKKFQRAGALGSDYAPMMLSGSSIADVKPPIPVREEARLRLLQQVQQAEIERFGAGLKTGQVIGKTTPDCVDVADRPVSAGDFFATICKALAIHHEDTYEAAGRPVPYTEMGSEPIKELF